MDPHNEMLLWYAAYRDTLTEDTTDQPRVSRYRHPARIRHRLSLVCGRAALHVAVWLLGDELQTTVWRGPDLSMPPASSRR